MKKRKNRLYITITIALVIITTQLTAQYTYPGRERWQLPERVLDSLSLERGMAVADIGAGDGYFTFRLAERVGTSGTVFAVDINRGYLDRIRNRAEHDKLIQVETILAEKGDPLLPNNSLDLVFLCNTYHHLHNRTAYFSNVKRYLKKGGRVTVIDFKMEHTPIAGHSIRAGVLRDEMEAAGYRLDKEYRFLPKQHFMVFIAAR